MFIPATPGGETGPGAGVAGPGGDGVAGPGGPGATGDPTPAM